MRRSLVAAFLAAAALFAVGCGTATSNSPQATQSVVKLSDKQVTDKAMAALNQMGNALQADNSGNLDAGLARIRNTADTMHSLAGQAANAKTAGYLNSMGDDLGKFADDIPTSVTEANTTGEIPQVLKDDIKALLTDSMNLGVTSAFSGSDF